MGASIRDAADEMTCPVDGAPSLSEAIPFCRECRDICPTPTWEAFTSGSANLRRVTDAIALRRKGAKEVNAGRFSRIDYRHNR